GGEDYRCVVGHLIQLLDENRALCLERVDDEPIMNDFMPHIDRRTILLDRTLHDLDRPVHAGAKPARSRDQEFEWQARIVTVRAFARGLKGSVHASPSSALHRVKLGDATHAPGHEYEHTRNAAKMTTRYRLLT